MTLKNPLFGLLCLNVFALAFYFFIASSISGIPGEESFFVTSDSKEYLGYSKWLMGQAQYQNEYRTFLYPCTIMVFRSLFGVVGMWIFQLVLWLVACNLTYLSILKIRPSKVLSAVGFLLVCTNVSAINLTLHGLTETTVFFLLSLLLFISSKNIAKGNFAQKAWQPLLVISLLAATKPVYEVLWFIFLCWVLLSFLRRPFIPRVFLLVLLACTPVILQKSLSFKKANSLSRIAGGNLREYYYRKLVYYDTAAVTQNFGQLPDSVHQAQIKAVKNTPYSTIFSFVFYHPGLAAIVYWENLQNNMASAHPYFTSEKNHALRKWTENINEKFFYLHIVFLLLWIFYLLIYRRRYNASYHFVFIAGSFSFYIFLSSGIVFWAGDRLVVPALAAWVPCYILLVADLVQRFKKNWMGRNLSVG